MRDLNLTVGCARLPARVALDWRSAVALIVAVSLAIRSLALSRRLRPHFEAVEKCAGGLLAAPCPAEVGYRALRADAG